MDTGVYRCPSCQRQGSIAGIKEHLGVCPGFVAINGVIINATRDTLMPTYKVTDPLSPGITMENPTSGTANQHPASTDLGPRVPNYVDGGLGMP